MDYRCGGTRSEDDCLENEKGAANDHKGAAKRGASHTRGTAMSFGFRRRPASGIPMPIASYSTEASLLHPRSKSAGPEQTRKRDDENTNNMMHNSSSGRSTPRLAPPKKESTGIAVRTNRFGYRQPQAKFTNKVGDICSSHTVSHYNQEKIQQQQQQLQQQQPQETYLSKQSGQPGGRVVQVYNAMSTTTKIRPQPVHAPASYNNANSMHTAAHADGNRRPSGIPEPVGRYTLHTSHLPLPQYAVRMTDANSKIAKTAANQSRKVSAASKSSTSSKEGSGTEDSGVGSQQGCPEGDVRGLDYTDGSLSRRRGIGRPRNLRMVVNGQSFDVRDVQDDDSTVTEISLIPLPKSFATANTGMVRERANQYQRTVNKDNRYTESTTSMSTTSSEGYDEGLGEEKVYKDRSHSEKIPSIKSDFSPPSSDDPEYGHGEAMADEYSLSSSDECHRTNSVQHLQPIPSTGKTNNALPKNTLRNVLLTIEDPAFAAAAATSTTLIDDETSPVDSLFDSPTASITQSDVKAPKKEHAMERSGNTIDDDSPGTPTNASNSLSLSEGREFFDDEIADQPGLMFDDNSRVGADPQSGLASQVVTENSHTLVESIPKTGTGHGKSTTNSPMHGRRISRAGSVDTLSPCESIASDDLILDYERSDTSSYEEQNRMDSNTALHDMDDATILSELEAQGEEVMRQWTSLLSANQSQQADDTNCVNNNVTEGSPNNNNQPVNDLGTDKAWKTSRSRSVTDSPRSVESGRNRQFSSPLRVSRNAQSPCNESNEDGGLRLDRDSYQYVFQDIVSIKTMLLKLQRVLQESEENGLTRAETLNPFDNSVKNGLFYNLNEGGTTDVSTSPGSGGSSIADELADLRREVVFLQGQIEDRDRTIQVLQFQMSKLQGPNGNDSQICAVSNNNGNIPSANTCNAATQTEKTRPVSAGPSLLQTLPQDGVMGPLVSWSDSWDRQRPSLLAELNGNRSPRKPSDRLPRTIRARQQEESSQHRQNGTAQERPPVESPSSRRAAQKPREQKTGDSNEPEQRAEKSETRAEGGSPLKSLIPMARKLAAPSLIPRNARAAPSTGRAHNT